MVTSIIGVLTDRYTEDVAEFSPVTDVTSLVKNGNHDVHKGSKVTLSADKEHIIELLNRRTHLVVLVLQELTCDWIVVLAIDLIRTDIALLVKVKLHQGEAPELCQGDLLTYLLKPRGA